MKKKIAALILITTTGVFASTLGDLKQKINTDQLNLIAALQANVLCVHRAANEQDLEKCMILMKEERKEFKKRYKKEEEIS